MFADQCRICLSQELLTYIFSKQESSTISTKLMSLTKIRMSPDDGLPNQICLKCIDKMIECIKFIELCETTDAHLRALLLSNDDDNALKLKHNKKDLLPIHSKEEYKYSPKSDTDTELFIDETDYNAISESNYESNDTLKGERTVKIKTKKRLKQKQQCPTCGKVMSSKYRLKTHLRTHTGERPYSCTHCSKTFSLLQSLKVHIRSHTGEKPLSCSICGETFAHSSGLVVHRRKHTGQTPYRCALCPRAFRTVGHLQYHIRLHTGEKKFECDTCGKAFITRGDLKQHLVIHTGDRPHICCVCGLRLTRSSNLKRHIQHAHNGLKPFSCTQCSENFTQKTDFEKHKKKHNILKDNTDKKINILKA